MDDAREMIELELTHTGVLNSLLSSPKTKPALMEECDVSRTTIDRWINRLETASLVHRPGDRFELTLFGRVVTLKFERMRTEVTNLIKLRDPLRTLAAEVDVDPSVLESANVSFYEGLAPEVAEELLTHDGRTRLLAPRVPCVFSVFLFRNPNPDLELEVVFEEGMATQLDAYFTNQHLSTLSVAEIDVYETPESPPFCLALVEHEGRSTAYFIFEGPHAGVGVIESSTEEAIEWGETLYGACRDRATAYELTKPDRPFGALPDRNQCLVLLELLAGNASHEADVITRGSNDEDSTGRDHLRALDEADYIEWDRETGAISKGPSFDDIRPILELITNHPEKLPQDWW